MPMPTVEKAKRELERAYRERAERLRLAVSQGLTLETAGRMEGLTRGRVSQILQRLETDSERCGRQ